MELGDWYIILPKRRIINEKPNIIKYLENIIARKWKGGFDQIKSEYKDLILDIRVYGRYSSNNTFKWAK